MSDPYLGEIRMVAFPNLQLPQNWALCDGSILSIDSYQVLYSLLGNNFGGDSITFALPNLAAVIPIHAGSGQFDIGLGTIEGQPSHILTQSEMPQHSHDFMAATTTGDNQTAQGNLLASFTGGFAPASAGPTVNLQATTVALTGGGADHENRQPYLCVNFMICIQGIYPS